jgi:hypothetical protein
MMSKKKVPVKTAEGVQEIKARALGLAPRIRTALLLVDGVRSAAELERLMQAAGVTTGALQMLLDKGLIRFGEDDQNTQLPADVHKPPLPADEPDHQATLFLEPMLPSDAGNSAAAAPPQSVAQLQAALPAQLPHAASPVEVVTLMQIETILEVATQLEVETIIGVATKLEATPAKALAPETVVKAPPSEDIRLPPLAQAERAYHAAANAQKKVAPASVLLMNLMAARAHIANALDQFLEIDGYLLKQKVVACESRDELEQLFRTVEAALVQKLERPAAARIMGIAHALLER